MLNKPYGYVEHLCVQCTNGGKGYPRQIIGWDNFRVQLPSICTRSMIANPTAPTALITYNHDDAVAGDQVYSNGFEKFFINNEKKLCPVTTCKLLKKGCATAWDGGDGNNIQMAATAPWAVTIKDNTFDGYGASEMCVECDNEYQKIYYDNVQIKQTARCIGKLVPKTFTALNQPWEWRATATPIVFATGWKDFFKNTDPDAEKVGLVAPNGCNPTKCSVMKDDCTTPWDFTKESGFTMDPSTFALSYTRSTE